MSVRLKINAFLRAGLNKTLEVNEGEDGVGVFCPVAKSPE